MASSRIAAVIDGLLTVARAALPGVYVVDGPVALVSEVDDGTENTSVLYIGSTLDDEPAATSRQDFAHLGSSKRDEWITVVCTAESVSGDLELKPRRDAVMAIMSAVEQATKQGVDGADPTLGGAALFCLVGERSQLRYLQSADGAKAELTFTVTARCQF